MTKGNRTNSSLLDSLPSETLLASKDMAWVKERIGSIWNEEPIIGDEESFANIEQLRAKLITGEDFLHAALGFCRLHFGTRPMEVADATLTFSMEAQPIYHKNFDLVSESFHKYLEDGYTLYILSDVEKQATRIRAILRIGETTYLLPPSTRPFMKVLPMRPCVSAFSRITSCSTAFINST